MHSNNRRAGRFARLGLESLESRTLLSATMPTTAALGQQARVSSLQVQSLTTVSYSSSWSISPGPLLLGTNSSTGNGKSTGCVMVALYAPSSGSALLGGSTVTLPVGVVSTSTSALPSSPDQYNTPFSLTLTLKDAGTGATGTLTFKGTVTGSLNWTASSLVLNIQNPTQKLTLGTRVFTVTLPGRVSLPLPGNPVKLNATVGVSAASSTSNQVSSASYSYGLGISPGSVLKGASSNTGYVMAALYRPGSATAQVGGAAVALPMAVLTSSSTATSAKPDYYNTTATFTVQIKDAASGISGTFTFKAALTGSLTATSSSLTLAFGGTLTQQLKLGARTYIVTLKTTSLKVPPPGGTPALVAATVQVL